MIDYYNNRKPVVIVGCDAAELAVVNEVLDELFRSNKLHPAYTTDPVRRVAIITEEVGEAMAEALAVTRTINADEHDAANMRHQHRADLYNETVQVAAMAIKLLVAMRKEQ